MADTQDSFTGNGTLTDYSFTFPYLKQSEVKASLDGTATTNFRFLTATKIQFVNNTTANTPTAPASGVKIKIYRETDSATLAATFYAGSAIKSEDLNDNFTQNLYATQEVTERYLSNLGGTMVGDLNLGEDVVLKFEGATDNDFETTLTVTDPTADRTITLPNETGTVITSAGTDVIDSAHYVAGSIDLEHMSANSVDSDQYVDGSIDLIHMSANSVDSDQYVDGSIDHVHLSNDCIDGDNIQNDAINSEHYAAGSIDLEHMSANSVDSDQYVDGSIDSVHIGNDQIDSQHYAAGSIDLEHMSANSVDSDQYVDGSIDLAHMSANSVDSDQYVDGSIDHVHLSNDCIDGDNIQDDVVNSEHIAAGAVDLEHMSANSVDSDQYVDGSIDRIHLEADIIDATKIADNAVTTDHIQDAELTTLAGMPSGTASILADSTALTATTAELNILDNKTFRASGDGTLTTTSDTEMPSSKVIAAHVASSITAVGGFKSIADEVSFPATASFPATGVAVSINNAAGVVVNGSGVSTTGRTVDGTPATVTINGFPSSLYGETLAAGVGLIVQATSTANTYTYHKLLAAETDVKQLSDDINDFNARYRVAGSAPGSNNDAGDLYFDTGANKMKVYNATTSQWDDVASVGNFYINTLSSSSGTGGGGATFGSGRYRFTLSNPPTMAQQLIVSVNGVIQKPNAGSSQPSEGFAIDGSDIIFSAAPAANSDYFIVTQGSSVSIGTPSDNTVSTAKIQNQAVSDAKILDNSIEEQSLKIHNTPSTGKLLKYTSNGMEWGDGDYLPLTGGAITGDTSISGTNVELAFGDGVKAQFGGGNDLSIHSDGTTAHLDGDLKIVGQAQNIEWDKSQNLLWFKSNTNGGQSAKAWWGDGISYGNLEIYMSTGGPAVIQTQNQNLQISTGNSSDINVLTSKDINFINSTGSTNYYMRCKENSGSDQCVELYYGNTPTKRLETTSTGINVIGQINVNGSALSAAPEITGTATGSIGANKGVTVKSDGTLEEIKTNTTFHDPLQSRSSMVTSIGGWSTGTTEFVQIVYHVAENRYYAIWNHTGGQGYVSTGTPAADGTVTWSDYRGIGATDIKEQFAFYDSTSERIVWIYRRDNDSGMFSRVIYWDASNSRAEAGSQDQFYSAAVAPIIKGVQCGDRVAAIFERNAGHYAMRLCVGTVNASTNRITWGSNANNWSTDGDGIGGSIIGDVVWDAGNSRVVCFGTVYGHNTFGSSAWTGIAAVGSLSGSGTSAEATFGSMVTVQGNSKYTRQATAYYDSANGKVVVTYTDNSYSSDQNVISGQVGTVSGTSISFGDVTRTTIHSNDDGHAVYNPDTGRGNTSWREASTNKWWVFSTSVSGTTLTFEAETKPSGGSVEIGPQTDLHCISGDYDTVLNRTIWVVSEDSNKSIDFSWTKNGTKSTNSANAIGFNKTAVTNGQTATVAVTGNTTTQSSLTAGTKYYFNMDGTLGTDSTNPYAGIALSSTKLLIKG